MAAIGEPIRSGRATALLAFGLIVNLTPLATFAAVLPEITRAWGLSASEAGWIGGIYFGGYALSVPVLASLTDRIDGRRIFIGCSLLGALASFAFAGCADGFWTALVLRFLNGVALAGVHMPGLKLLAERTSGRARARGTAIYVSSFTLGAAGSFLIAGAADAALGWRATFTTSGIAPLSAIASIALLPPASEAPPVTPLVFDFRPVLHNRALMAYVLAFAGNLWEVSAVRAWFVAYLAWTLSLPHHYMTLPEPAVISGIASLIGFPVSVAIAELALHWGPRAIVATCFASVAILCALAATTGGPTLVILPLLVLAQVASLADASALASGAVAAADPSRRGTALAVYAFIGYMAAFFGPAVVGVALDRFGGANHPLGWSAAFMVMTLGSTAAAWFMRAALRRHRESARCARAPGL
ncbi:MAG TPA: MFS transporter [Stellaceae bacterium]|nr:MFS transporter [Stellaceae bacterium]